MEVAERFEEILARGKDSASLRFALGTEYLKLGDHARAVEHLKAAVALDAKFSAAWKLLGRAQTRAGLEEQAAASYRKGIEAAAERGDVQAAKEMKVFLKRLEKRDRQ